MRVLLIQPTLTLRDYVLGQRPPMYEPLGLAYLAAVARDEPVVLDCVAEDWANQSQDGAYVRIRNGIRRKLLGPENFAYGMRVFGTFTLRSLKQRKLGIAF